MTGGDRHQCNFYGLGVQFLCTFVQTLMLLLAALIAGAAPDERPVLLQHRAGTALAAGAASLLRALKVMSWRQDHLDA